MEIRRGTTPTICIEIPEEIDASKITAAYVTLNQDGTELEKNIEDLTITEQVLSFDLTQEETLNFNSLINGWIQIRLKLKNETAVASQKEVLKILPIIKEGAI